MSSEVEMGNWAPYKGSKPDYSFSEIANQEYDRFNKAEKVSSYVEGVIGAYDRRNDEIFKATGEKLFNPLRDIPGGSDLAEMQSAYRDMVGGGTVDKSRATFQQEWFASRYEQRLKDVATKYPHLASVIQADRSPILDHAEAAQRAEQKSAEMADRLGMVDVRESMPSLKKVPVLPDIANLTANIATNPKATVAQFWGGLQAQMLDPVEASMNLVGFGAGRASMSVLKTAMLNAAANAAVEAVANPLRQYNRKEMGLDYGWDRFFSDVSGAAATGFMLDAGVRGIYRAGITRFGKDVPEGQAFSKHGRGGAFFDAIPQMDPIKPVVREKITPEEYEKAKAGDINAIDAIAKKSGAYDDPAVKGMIDYAKLGGVIDDAMVKHFEAMKIDHGEGMAAIYAAINVADMRYTRMPDPIPQATRALDTAGAAELAPRLAEIDQRLAEAPQSVRQAIRAGIEAGIPEIVDAARKAVSGDLEGMRKAIADAGGEQALTDRVIVHTATNPISVAMALRRSPQVMDSNVSLRTDMMRMARAIAALDEPAFRMVLEGKAHPLAGQIVADMVPPGRHAQVLEQVANFRSMDDAKAAIPDLIPEPSRAPEATGTRVSDPAGPEAKAQIDDLEKAHKAEVDRATEPARKREELESKVETLKGEIAKLEEQSPKMAALSDRGKASLDETILSPPEQKLLAKLTERTGLKPEDIAEQRAQGQSFGKKIDAALDKATKFEGVEKAADELATKRQELRAAERELEQVQLDQARTLQDPALFNAVMRRAALQRQLDVRRAIDDALRLGNRMLPENTRVEVRTDEMVDPASGYRLDASSDMATGDIALASYALNPAGRIGHEGVHTLITKGHVAPEEVKLLAKMARDRGLFKDEAKYREAYAGRDNLDALIDEEAAAHAIEARINGTDIGPANTMADRIKQLIERIRNALDGYGFKTADDVARAIIEGRAAEREARAEWMRNNGETAFAIADTNTGRSMRADLDRLGYYSKALEAAKSLKQAKGTPEQMLAQLKAAGVKDAEIEATNLRSFLDGKTSITRDEIVKHLTEHRVGVNERKYGEQKYVVYGNDGRRIMSGPNPPSEGALAGSMRFAPFRIVEGTGVSVDTKWSSYSLDPSNPTYRETVLHLPAVVNNKFEVQPTNGGFAIKKPDGSLFVAPGRREPEIYPNERLARQNAEAMGVHDNANNFNSGHFSEPNIIGHMMTSMNRHEGKPVFTLDQIQSDWGQKLRDGGMRDAAKIADLEARIKDMESKWRADRELQSVDSDARALAAEAYPDNWLPANARLRLPERKSGNQWEALQSLADDSSKPIEMREKASDLRSQRHSLNSMYEPTLNMLRAELRTAEAATPGHPLVNTTDQWTITTLRRALRQAAEADAAFIAIPHGDTVLSYNPGDAKGMRGFYGSDVDEGIVPKNLRKLLEKIDKEAARPQRVKALETPSGMRSAKPGEPDAFIPDKTGFTLFPLTDKVKRSVMEEGQALFALSREPIDMSPEARKARAEQMGFDTGKVWYRGEGRGIKTQPESFDLSKVGSRFRPFYAVGIHFTDLERDAKSYAMPGNYFGEYYVRAKKTYVVDADSMPRSDVREFTDRLIAEGYDSVLAKAPEGSPVGNELIIFDPTNIRSVNATFDPAEAGSARLLAAFAGENAKTADLDALAKAKQMDAEGKPREAIWTDTGWFKGVDGKWRFEISDHKAYFDENAAKDLKDILAEDGKSFDYMKDTWPFGGVVGHRDLFGAYPALSDLQTHFIPNSKFGSIKAAFSDKNGGRISFNDALDAESGRSYGLHESQHAIQAIESFARGGRHDNWPKEMLEAERARIAAEQAARPKLDDWTAVDNSIAPADMTDVDLGRSLYRRLAGEAEARLVQKRINMTPEERRARPPWLDYDVPEADQIVRMANDKMFALGRDQIEQVWGPKFDIAMGQQYRIAEAAGDFSTMYDILSAKLSKASGIEPEMRAGMEAKLRELYNDMGPEGRRAAGISDRPEFEGQKTIGSNMFALNDNTPPDPLKSDMAVVDRMSSLKELIEACR